MTEQLNKDTPLERKLVPMNKELEPVAQGRSLIAVIGINEYTGASHFCKRVIMRGVH
jgi:hypothetical protein